MKIISECVAPENKSLFGDILDIHAYRNMSKMYEIETIRNIPLSSYKEGTRFPQLREETHRLE